MHAKRSTPGAQPQAGLVVASHGRHCVVETPQGRQVICHPRGKKLGVAVGDRVFWQVSADEGVIERITPRRNLLYRQDALRTKTLAANLDQALILLAAEPAWPEHLLARALIACEAAHIAPLVALNKSDLAAPFARAWERLAPYRAMGYAVLPIAVKTGDAMAALTARLQGRATLILGPSGAGKSTLINLLAPGAAARTSELSRALGSGKQTTTTTTWYWLDAARTGALIDSPGFQEFGLHHISPRQLAAFMPDIGQYAAQCRFHNCTHLHEPGCGIIAALTGNAISANRYKIYSDLFRQLGDGRGR
ncbi:MAG: ribosome small subunit-dependent GTPase A [Burkholderiaceae bacterium]|nr:ribosome small subunit-dependent GTPase A [Burkholderiaceae bacterium]